MLETNGESHSRKARSSSRELRIRIPFLFSAVYFSRVEPSQPNKGKRALLGDLGIESLRPHVLNSFFPLRWRRETAGQAQKHRLPG